ncbi:MAG: alpha-amylase family glycosyl hydrolase [Bacteroidota bacterium]
MNRVFIFVLCLAISANLLAQESYLGRQKTISSSVQENGNFIEVGYSWQLNSMITLQPDSTWVWVTDFVANMNRLDSITCSSGLRIGIKNKAWMVSNGYWVATNGSRSWSNKYVNRTESFSSIDSILVRSVSGNPNTLQWLRFWEQGEYTLVPVRVSEKVQRRFVYMGDRTQKVQVKGSFTAWRAVDLKYGTEDVKYTSENGSMKNLGLPIWKTSLWVGPGTHQYVFIVNGKEIRDPLTPDSISNGMGGFNSVFTHSTRAYFAYPQLIKQEKTEVGSTGGWTVYPPLSALDKAMPGLEASKKPDTSNKKSKRKSKGSKRTNDVSSTTVKNDKTGNTVIEVAMEAPYRLPIEGTATKLGSEFNCGDVSFRILALWNNIELENVAVTETEDGGTWIISIPIDPRLAGRFWDSSLLTGVQQSYIRMWVGSNKGISNDVLIPMQNGLPVLKSDDLIVEDPHKKIIYNPMIDRFVNGNLSNDKPLLRSDVDYKVDFYGGDVAGITKKIEEGYFNLLGINTLWISPVVKNPAGPYGQWKNPATKFSGYHGYWPVALRETDERFCTPDELKKFIRVAHSHGISVLLDYVAHHIHEEHPLYKQRPDWFTPLILPDGSKNTERWDDYRLTTWFDDFMPTFNYFKPEVVDALTDSALWWFKEFDVDGFRHDATKHIPDAFWRTLSFKVKRDVQYPAFSRGKSRSLYQIGETYGSAELIGSYLGSGLLDAQFDFNMYDAVVGAFKGNGGMNQLANTLQDSRKWYGSHHTMGNISGNQDKPRIISILDGSIKEGEDSKQAGWDRNIRVSDPGVYDRLSTLFAYNFSIPGIPVIYYGDEIGMPGANDPDSRRMMRFSSGYQGSLGDMSTAELLLRQEVGELAKFRSESMALLYGELETSSLGDSVLVIRRRYFGESVWTIINNSNSSIEVKINTETGKAEIISILPVAASSNVEGKKNNVQVGVFQAKSRFGKIDAFRGGIITTGINEPTAVLRVPKKKYEILGLSGF